MKQNSQFCIQIKITRPLKKQRNMTHNQNKKQPIEKEPDMTENMDFINKDLKTSTINLINMLEGAKRNINVMRREMEDIQADIFYYASLYCTQRCCIFTN